MFLNDIGNSPATSFKKINYHLKTNYGFKISENIGESDLSLIVEKIEEEVNELKLKGDDSKNSPEISKRLLILEGIKSLKESAMFIFQSPDFNKVISALADFVHGNFCISGTSEDDFNHCIKDAMSHYRSSKYRFPDDMVESRIRECALDKLRSYRDAEDDVALLPVVDESDFEMIDDGLVDESEDENLSDILSHDYKGKPFNEPDSVDEDSITSMSRNPDTGKIEPDEFAIHESGSIAFEQINQGTMMKEKQNLVRNLRRLLETQVSQAEVITAAKDFAEELQEMIEKIGRLQNEDLPPVTDQMRETFGPDSASAFQTEIYGALQGVMDSLYTAKNQVDDSVTRMAETGQFTASNDMEKDINQPGTEMDSAPADLDNVAAELGAEAGAEAGAELGAEAGAEAGAEEPVGRAKKLESLQIKVREMQKLVEKVKKLKKITT